MRKRAQARATAEGVVSIEVKTIGRVNFKRHSAHITLHHTHHNRVEVPHPSELKALILITEKTPRVLRAKRINEQRLNTAPLVFRKNTKHNTKEALSRAKKSKPHKEFDALKNPKTPLEPLNERVNIRNHNAEGDRLTTMKNKPNEARINNGFHLTKEVQAFALREGREAIEVLPRRVIDSAEVLRSEVYFSPRDVAHKILLPITVISKKSLGTLCNNRAGRAVRGEVVGDLIEIVAEAIPLKECAIVWRIVVILKERSVLKPLDEEPPPRITRPEVYRSIHSIEAAQGEPLPSSVEERL